MREQKDKKYTDYGLQLLLDAYDADSEKLGQVDLVRQMLLELPGKIGMEIMSKPLIKRCDRPIIKGITGIIVIVESHIVIHTYELKNFLTADVYSCKTFDPQIAIDYLANLFGFSDFDKEVKRRGKRFPTD